MPLHASKFWSSAEAGTCWGLSTPQKAKNEYQIHRCLKVIFKNST